MAEGLHGRLVSPWSRDLRIPEHPLHRQRSADPCPLPAQGPRQGAALVSRRSHRPIRLHTNARGSGAGDTAVSGVCEAHRVRSGKGVFSDNVCDSPAQLEARAPDAARAVCRAGAVETYLPGTEFTVAILGNAPRRIASPSSASTSPRFLRARRRSTLRSEVDLGHAGTAARDLQVPAPVRPGPVPGIARTALDAYHALGCRDGAAWTSAWTVRRAERARANPLPGIIPDPAMNSCFPKAARAAGLSYDELVQEVVHIAWRRLTGRDVGFHAGAVPQPARAIA